MFIDIHTHKKQPESGAMSVVSLDMMDDASQDLELLKARDILIEGKSLLQQQFLSVGLHPWHIDKSFEKRIRQLENAVSSDFRVIMIGEAGLDRVCGSDYALQKAAFIAQVAVSEKYGLPMIIHCVKAFDDLLAIRKAERVTQKWILHGFRGKPQQADQLVSHGIDISFGEKYNADSVRFVSKDKLWLETDESTKAIGEIYASIAEIKRMDIVELEKEIEKKFKLMLSRQQSPSVYDNENLWVK